MPEIGEIRSGNELGFKVHGRLIWWACRDCGNKRWVRLEKGNLRNERCRICALREQNSKPRIKKRCPPCSALGCTRLTNTPGVPYCRPHERRLQRGTPLEGPIATTKDERYRRVGRATKARMQKPENKEKVSRQFKRLWQDPDFIVKTVKARVKAQQASPNKLEHKLIELIRQQDLPFRYVGNGQVVIGRYCPDFINVDGAKQIIELFGTYWHNIFDIARKKQMYANYGFTTLIIWEDEMDNPEKVILKLKRFSSKRT